MLHYSLGKQLQIFGMQPFTETINLTSHAHTKIINSVFHTHLAYIIKYVITNSPENIKNNAWVTVNNEFWVTSGAICQWKSFANRITSDPKIVIHGSKCIIIFLTRYFMSLEHSILLKTIIDRSFRNCRQGRSFLTSHCDVTRVDLWRHANAGY